MSPASRSRSLGPAEPRPTVHIETPEGVPTLNRDAARVLLRIVRAAAVAREERWQDAA